ncbi:TetR/AcrR family transcriptional regulator [Ochrobactrum daejeonense]|uniref:TetR/AcrR family transcriptional regulator n=1 Tax=Brucella daejeonensis TaxID=659015 RepID=A0A7W9AWP3_9HYPH|nr:TetR/AcrR family transcriptional regulator [Brucella daejeonensis]MBB5701988.1 TetR/AcrR family transcriptional regulator [Brucella daejeonensis]
MPIKKGNLVEQAQRQPRKLQGPNRRDPVASRQKILEAGMRHFARAGLDGARVVDIIREAEFSHRMLYHYFKSKEELYEATLEFAYQQIRDAERKLHLEKMEPVEGISLLVAFTFDYYVQHPEFMALLSQENLNGGRYVHRSGHMGDIQKPLISSLEGLMKRGVEKGVFGRMFDPVQFYIDIAGLCYFGFANRHTLSATFDASIGKDSYLAERRQHVIDFTIAALTGPERK